MHHPTPSNLTKTLEDISDARLSSYRSFFSPSNDAELYGLYCWNDSISSCFMRLIGVTEVTLRNRFHGVISQHMSHGTSNPNNSNDWFNHIGLLGKSKKNIEKITHDITWPSGQYTATPKNPPVSPNQVIANMTFGFWPILLDCKSLPWGDLLPLIIPNHRYSSHKNYWASQINIDGLYERLCKVRDLRNRVAHFEPLWKLKDIFEEKRSKKGSTIVPAIEYPSPQTAAESLHRLNVLYNRTTQLLFWLSKERAQAFMLSEVNQTATYLLTEKAIHDFKIQKVVTEAKLNSLTKSWGMKLILKERRPIWVYQNKKLVGRYYPEP